MHEAKKDSLIAWGKKIRKKRVESSTPARNTRHFV